MRLLVARCEVLYTGRLTAKLPEAVRLLMLKPDGSFLVHDDAGGYRPLNCSLLVSARFWPGFRPRIGLGIEPSDRSGAYAPTIGAACMTEPNQFRASSLQRHLRGIELTLERTPTLFSGTPA